MTKEALKLISDSMESVGIPYEYMEFTDPASVDSYWVGSYSEIVPMNEDGMMETQFILTGTAKGTWLNLENQKATIETLFPSIEGKRAILDNIGVAIFYGNAFPVPTGDAFLKRFQINITIKEWKVN